MEASVMTIMKVKVRKGKKRLTIDTDELPDEVYLELLYSNFIRHYYTGLWFWSWP
jgi:hypothetical protein